MSEFAEHAIADADGTNLTTNERIAMTLVGDIGPKRGLTPYSAQKITKARISFAMSELVALNVENVHKWLGEVASQSPAKAIELFMQLAEFSLPKLKAMAINVTSPDGSVRALSMAELEARVVSEQ